MRLSLFALAYIVLTSIVRAEEFRPIYKETKSFKISATQEFRGRTAQNTGICRIVTRFNEDLGVIEIRMGVLGSGFDYFGWDMNIPMWDFPLRDGYEVNTNLGGSPMVLSYKANKLTFKFVQRDLFSRIFPFELTIDANLQNPKFFKSSMEGWERASFGGWKKHVTEECTF